MGTPGQIEENLDGSDLSVAIVVARFNQDITDRLLDGATRGLDDFNVPQEQRLVVGVPGAFELGLVAKQLASSGNYDAVICLGCVIKGETDHDIYVSQTAARLIADASYDTGVPVIFGVLTTNNHDQALARASDGKTNKGYEAAAAAVSMANLLRDLRSA